MVDIVLFAITLTKTAISVATKILLCQDVNLVHCQASSEGRDARGGQPLAWGLGLCPSNFFPPSSRRRRGYRKVGMQGAAAPCLGSGAVPQYLHSPEQPQAARSHDACQNTSRVEYNYVVNAHYKHRVPLVLNDPYVYFKSNLENI